MIEFAFRRYGFRIEANQFIHLFFKWNSLFLFAENKDVQRPHRPLISINETFRCTIDKKFHAEHVNTIQIMSLAINQSPVRVTA